MQVLKGVGGVVTAPFKWVGSGIGSLFWGKPGNGKPSELAELDKEQVTECYTYGLFAQCAYSDTVAQAQETLSQCAIPKKLEGTLDQLVNEKGLRLLKYSSKLGALFVNTDTEVVLAKLKTDKGYELVMAFRGTEVTWADGLSDALTDVKIIMEPATDIGGLKGRKDLDGCKVHRGFKKSFNDVVNGDRKGTPPMLDVVKELFPNGEKPVRVVCCGHSLGGALCTLAAFWCKATKEAFQGVDVACYAFASPRVGNEVFVKKFDELIGKSSCYRFTHKSDIVPAVPPSIPYLSDYRHVSKPVFLLQPARDDYGIYGDGKKPEADRRTAYAAVLVEREGFYRNTDHHSMGLYVAAMADVMGLREISPKARKSLHPPVPPEMTEKEAEANAGFLASCMAMEGPVAADAAAETVTEQ